MYLGFDLSTQQLKGVVIRPDLSFLCQASFDFDRDSSFDVSIGVVRNDQNEVYAPVEMWLEALDAVLESLKKQGVDFAQVQGISGAGQQHGSVYWNSHAAEILESLDASKSLQEQLRGALSHPFSPNWQDASTQKECDLFDAHLGSAQELANVTGSHAHHRFTGPQILRFRTRNPEVYGETARISLVSSFLASVFLGDFAQIDISDVCGMNLWDIKQGKWHDSLMELAGGKELHSKLGSVAMDSGASLGNISPYFVSKYSFSPGCKVFPFTGDNPSTLLSLALQPLDAMLSLGTSTTFLMSTPRYEPDPSVHFFNHPTTAGLYMFMLCYKNGGPAREQVRDKINADGSKEWDKFNEAVLQPQKTSNFRFGLYFPLPETVPNVGSGVWRYKYDPASARLAATDASPAEDARLIVESQMLSCRLRAQRLVASPAAPAAPAQPRRLYLVGGGARNPALARVAGAVFGGAEGVFRLEVGANACALGSAYKAVWACERQEGELFEDFVRQRWDGSFAEKIGEGYEKGTFEHYGEALKGFKLVEETVLRSVEK